MMFEGCALNIMVNLKLVYRSSIIPPR